MIIPHAALPEVSIIRPDKLHRDNRGTFAEAFRIGDLTLLFDGMRFVQSAISQSEPFVLRGLHYQTRSRQAKLIRCVTGAMFQVSVDVRKDSETFGRWASTILTAATLDAVFVPPGFANGLYATENGATAVYEMTAYHDPELERALAWDDPTVEIQWPFARASTAIMSGKDRGAPRLDAIEPWSAP